MKKSLRHFTAIFFFTVILLADNCYSQFPPGAGHAGTTAMYADSSAFIGWASSCQVTRGYVNISDTTVVYLGSNRAAYGNETDACGKADYGVVSLGDGGSALLTFDSPIANGQGPDFAVFENSVDGSFLELGFVEVSSDGTNFFRFPSTSLTQDTAQVPTFGTMDPTLIDNFAGKYQVLFGTPFDLELLSGTPGLDVNKVTHVRIIDVVGDILAPYATHDSHGNIVNDPWPTPFNTCGFDLDAVGVINAFDPVIPTGEMQHRISLCPNPVTTSLTINIPGKVSATFILLTAAGVEVQRTDNVLNNTTFSLSSLPAGLYLGLFKFPDGSVETRRIIKL